MVLVCSMWISIDQLFNWQLNQSWYHWKTNIRQRTIVNNEKTRDRAKSLEIKIYLAFIFVTDRKRSEYLA